MKSRTQEKLILKCLRGVSLGRNTNVSTSYSLGQSLVMLPNLGHVSNVGHTFPKSDATYRVV